MAVRRTLAPLCASLLLLVSAAGCAEDKPEVKIAPSASPTPTAAASASPSEAAETPEEFIRRWAEIERTMVNTGDTTEYELITRRCVACRKLADQIESYYSAGGYAKWDGLEIKRIRRGAGLSFTLFVLAAPTELKTSRKAAPRTLDGGPNRYRVELDEVGGRYFLSYFAVVAS